MTPINLRDRKVRARYYARTWLVCLVMFLLFTWLPGMSLWPGGLWFLGWSVLVFGLWEWGERRRDREYRDDGLT